MLNVPFPPAQIISSFLKIGKSWSYLDLTFWVVTITNLVFERSNSFFPHYLRARTILCSLEKGAVDKYIVQDLAFFAAMESS